MALASTCNALLQGKDTARSLGSFTHSPCTSQCPSPLCYLNRNSFPYSQHSLINFLLQFFHICSTWLSIYLLLLCFLSPLPQNKDLFLLCSVVGTQSAQSIFDVLMLFITHLPSLNPCLTDISSLGVWPRKVKLTEQTAVRAPRAEWEFYSFRFQSQPWYQLAIRRWANHFFFLVLYLLIC